MSDETKPDPSAIKWRTVHADSYGRVMLDRVEVPEGCFYCVYDEPGGKIVGTSFCPSSLPALVAEVERLRSELAECYRITGADPDGDDDAMLARKAVNAVRRLREESDHQGTRADEFAEEVKKMAGERDAAHAAIELIKTDRRFAQENADGYRVRLGIVMRENDTFAETVKKLRDDLAEAAGVNAANLNTIRELRALPAKGGAA